MNERNIITITILATCGFVILLVGLILTILLLRRRCRQSKATTTQETDRNSKAATPAEEGLANLALDEDGLVAATNQRETPEAKPKVDGSGLDPKLQEMLDNAYADARKFAKFPHMP